MLDLFEFKWRMNYGVSLIVLLLVASPLTCHAVESHFPVYDGIKSKGKPDFSIFGLLPIRVLYTAMLWEKDDSLEEPNVVKIQSVASGLPLNSEIPVCIDIEHWPVKGKPEVVNASIAKLSKAVATVKAVRPNAKVGFYSLLPIRDYWRANGSKGFKSRDSWMRENMALKPLSKSVDIVFPSLYTFYNDPKGWEKYAIENIMEAKKYGKPVYVFLWPMFHDKFPLGGQYIPADFWKLQLETCRKYADGIVIWNKSTTEWSGNAAWWAETLKFLETLH